MALHKADRPNSDEEIQQAVPAGRCRPGLVASNIEEFHKRLIEKGVPCIQEPKELHGIRIAQYADPDGLGISVSEKRGGS